VLTTAITAWPTSDGVASARWVGEAWHQLELIDQPRAWRLDASGDLLLVEVRQHRHEGIHVYRQDGDGWQAVGSPLAPGKRAEAAVLDLPAGPTVALTDPHGIQLWRFTEKWERLGPLLRVHRTGAPRLALWDGQPAVAWRGQREIGLARLDGEWRWLGPEEPACDTGTNRVTDLALAPPAMAFAERGAPVVCQWTGTVWHRLPPPSTRVTASPAPDVLLAWPDVAWMDDGIQLRRWSGSAWSEPQRLDGSRPAMTSGAITWHTDRLHVASVR
jgi:hypothetical protein